MTLDYNVENSARFKAIDAIAYRLVSLLPESRDNWTHETFADVRGLTSSSKDKMFPSPRFEKLCLEGFFKNSHKI